MRLGSGLDILTLIRLDKFRCRGLFCVVVVIESLLRFIGLLKSQFKKLVRN